MVAGLSISIVLDSVIRKQLGPGSWGAHLDPIPNHTIIWVECLSISLIGPYFSNSIAKNIGHDCLVKYENYKLTWFHKIGRISANYGPILKIQNLAYSAERSRPYRSYYALARRRAREDVARERTSLRTSQSNRASIWIWLLYPLLWAYLENREVDVAHFRQADWYGGVWYIYQKWSHFSQY